MELYPLEVRQVPRCVVCLVGCSSLHPSVSSVLSKRVDLLTGREEPVFNLLTVDGAAALPDRKKERRQSYEGYLPTGVLKAAWLYKHNNLFPAAAVMFFALDDDKPWRARENDIAAEIDRAKSALRSRNSKLLVVLVHRAAQGDLSSDERVTTLRRRADLDSKNLLFFDKDSVTESVKRLEKVLHELCRTHYKEEAKKLKKDSLGKSNLQKSTQHLLSVRHHFKIAYYAEFRRDTRTSQKYYTSAWNLLKDLASAELKGPAVKMREFKAVADCVNFLICKLHLSMGNTSEAITQFQKHIKAYKNAIGIPELEFTHWDWVSNQYLVFGELLQRLAPAVQPNSNQNLQHPGFYYQAAARYAMDRKTHAKRLCEPSRSSLDLERFSKEFGELSKTVLDSNSQYIGQNEFEDLDHPLQGESPAASDKPVNIPYARLLAQELLTDHSARIIALLSKAYEQYNNPQSTRMLYSITSQMAQEYFVSGQYEASKKLLDRIALRYSKEGWWILLTPILHTSLKCAQKLGLVKAYIECAFELLALNSTLNLEERKQIHKDMELMMTNPAALEVVPLTEPTTISLLPSYPMAIGVHFTSDWAYAKSSIQFLLRVKSMLPLPIRFNKLRIQFSDVNYNREIVDSSIGDSATRTESLLFEPNKTLTFAFDFVSSENLELGCKYVILELGDPAVLLQHQLPETEAAGQKDWLGQVQRSKTKFVAHEAKVDLKVHHLQPALVDEYYEVELILTNNGDDLVKGQVNLCILPSADESYFVESIQDKNPLSSISLQPLSSGCEQKHVIFYYSSVVQRKKITFKAVYETSSGYTCSVDVSTDIPVQVPFSTQFNFFTRTFQPLPDTSIVMDQPFFLYLDVQCTTSFPLCLTTATLQLNEEQGPLAKCLGTSACNDTEGFALTKENKYTVWYQLSATASGENLQLGNIRLEWQRSQTIHGGKGQPVYTTIPLPLLTISTSPFSVHIDVPPFAIIGNLTPFHVSVHNHTDLLQQFRLAVEDSGQAFLFSGDKEGPFSVHPHSTHTIKHNLIPIHAGRQPLPHFRVFSRRMDTELSQTKQIGYIFVNPGHWSGD